MSDAKVSGVIHLIEETKTYGNKGFRKRLVVLEQDKGSFTNYIPVDFIGGVIVKPVFFGAIIAITGCYFGLKTSGGTEGVGRAATRAVVTTSIFILATDYFLTQVLIALLME